MHSFTAQYIQAITWFILSLMISCCNDAITKYLSDTLHAWEITFFRFGFGAFTLLPLLVYTGKQAFYTSRWGLHMSRGLLLFLAIGLWTEGLKTAPITTATVMSFSVPLFVLLFSPLLLQERVSWPMWLLTLGGFIGVVLVLQPGAAAFNARSWLFLLAVMLFALLDILNKKYIAQESTLSMLFYSSIVACMCTTYPAMQVWQTPSLSDGIYLLLLGIGGNLILYFLLRAFALANATSLAPFRYVELFISMLVSYVCFQELPTVFGYLGAAVVIPCTLLVGYLQTRKISDSA